MLLFSVLPSRNAAPPANPTGAQQKAAAVPESVSPVVDILQSPCREIENRIREFLPDKESAPENKVPPEKKVFAPEECYNNPGPRDEWTPADDKASDLQFLIATLPNPIHTHFALEFDRLTDALQQAAQDEAYNYDSSWLPWFDRPQQYSSFDARTNRISDGTFAKSSLVCSSFAPPCPTVVCKTQNRRMQVRRHKLIVRDGPISEAC